jgi:hypothetical protein
MVSLYGSIFFSPFSEMFAKEEEKKDLCKFFEMT